MTNTSSSLELLSGRLGIRLGQVKATADLLAGGATVPFIARYRKEQTGSLDELGITAIRDGLQKQAELDKRKQTILESLAGRDLLTKDLEAAVRSCETLPILEDIYLPFRPKRKTRAGAAREKGLEPLAAALLAGKNVDTEIDRYINPERGVADRDEAMSGARDIIAEHVSEDRECRALLRTLFAEKGLIVSRVVAKNKETGIKFSDYFDWQEPVRKSAGHRLLALFRGEQEKVLTLTIRPPEEEALAILQRKYVRDKQVSPEIRLAVEDSYKRLLAPSLENELRASLKERTDEEAIAIFSANLRQLLLAAPLGPKRVMALDPGFRTGAKLVCLDEQGGLLCNTAIYPTHGGKKALEAADTVRSLCAKYAIDAIAIGNGTAGRETETFVRALKLDPSLIITMVDESGASIYSASEVAREEFPDHDVTVRGAVSIGRRLQDPLAELVKIDPKSIGVGQYQHDVDQSELKKSLDDVVASCVNSVGVEVNTASKELLTRVAGLGPVLAANIIAFRRENGPFTERKQLLKVPRLGAKAFEQCAGFLRIGTSSNPLDASGVHPERYALVARMAADAGCSVRDLIRSEEARQKIVLKNYVSETVGMETLLDIAKELAKPGRDPRAEFSRFSFAENVHSLKDLELGMILPGIVTNVTAFGAFVDIGVHQDGLIHISQLADRFVKDPAEIVSVRQQVKVKVLEIDTARNRIALSLRL